MGPAVHGHLDTIRDGHPTAPIVVEETPGPCAFDAASFGTGRLRFVATGDPGGGRTLPDDLYLDAVTHQLIGERLAEATFSAGGPFAGPIRPS